METEAIKGLTWYVVWTKWNADSQAKASLESKGFEVLQPTQRKTISHAGKRMIVVRPVFPRYLFAGTNGSWYAALSCTGVSALISNAQKPVEVPFWVMKNLYAAQEAEAFDSRPKDTFAAGDKVAVVGSALDGFVGVIRSASPGRRISVLIEMAGRKKEFSIPISNLSKMAHK